MTRETTGTETRHAVPRASIRQVAERAGVSSVTVSNVLRGQAGRASEETRARVLEAARALNYVPVPQPAVQNRRIETRTIGFVSDDVDVDDQEGLGTYLGLREGAISHGYDVLTLLRARQGWAFDRDETRFLDRRSDGFIFVAPHERRAMLEALIAHGVPTVVCYNADAPPGAATVLLDEEGAMQLAVRHLIDAGHTRIGYMTGLVERIYFRQRREGFRKAMRAAGLDRHAGCMLPAPDFGGPNDAEVMRLIESESLTAVVCAHDGAALRLWDLAEAHGLRIPEDLAITGMDNTLAGAERGLTSVAFPFADVGRAAVDALVALIRGAEPAGSGKTIPVEIVARGSTQQKEERT